MQNINVVNQTTRYIRETILASQAGSPFTSRHMCHAYVGARHVPTENDTFRNTLDVPSFASNNEHIYLVTFNVKMEL